MIKNYYFLKKKNSSISNSNGTFLDEIKFQNISYESPRKKKNLRDRLFSASLFSVMRNMFFLTATDISLYSKACDPLSLSSGLLLSDKSASPELNYSKLNNKMQ